MKIEKINDNQIRCTLTRADLADRQLKLSELAYGSEKAKSLFHDMMQQAAHECGFEAEDIPLMIEAIPASADSIVLIITKVEDSKRDGISPKLDGAEDLLNLLGKVKESISAVPGQEQATPDKADKKPSDLRLFSFGTMDSAIYASQLLSKMYHGSNTLYKDTDADMFILALTQSDHTSKDFNRICNMLSEYGSQENSSGATLAYLEEHCDIILAADAVQQLAQI